LAHLPAPWETLARTRPTLQSGKWQVRSSSLHFRDVGRYDQRVESQVDGIDPTTGATHTTLASDRSNVGAVYTGLAIATNKEGQTFLYAADDGPNRRIDIFYDTFSLVKSFGDPAIPRGFSPCSFR